MSIFDDEVPKKKLIKEQSQQTKQEGKGKRYRNKKKKQKEQLLIAEKKEEEKKIEFPPLIIKARTQENEQQIQHPLEQFVNEIYENYHKKIHNKIIQSFLKEDDEGNIEYKLMLVNPTEDRLQHLTSQMRFRVSEGLGQAYYRIGVEDNGRPLGLERDIMFESLKTICYLANKIRSDVMVIRIGEGLKGLVAELMIRKMHRQGVKMEIRLLLCGESGSGKSTLLGVLKTNMNDDGRGSARVKVFNHKHEFTTGATMSKSHHVIAFDQNGKLINQESMISMEKWMDQANKLLYFIDVGGHKKAEKQLVSSLCSFFPEYALWVISGKSSEKEIPFNTESLELATIFNLPMIVVITHLDEIDKDEELDIIFKVKDALKKLCPAKTPCVVREVEHAVLFSRITSTEDVIPIFLISNVTCKNLKLLTSFLNLLTSNSQFRNNQELYTEFSISDKWVVDGNIILAGTVVKGNIKRRQLLHIGPDLKGSFRTVEVTSIQCLRVPVKLAKSGQICTVGIRPLSYAQEWLKNEPNAIRRGMVLVDSKKNPKATFEFLAEFAPYSSQKQEIVITQKYLPVVNTLTTRQICTIVLMKNKKQSNLEVPSPNLFKKKKSKSIEVLKNDSMSLDRRWQKGWEKDTNKKFQKNISVQNIKEHKKNPKFRTILKKSVDLTEQFEKQQEKKTRLSPIKEENGSIKKKKQIEQIKFSDMQMTPLRLRFKYNPQYVNVGQKVVINELKLVGRIKQIYY